MRSGKLATSTNTGAPLVRIKVFDTAPVLIGMVHLDALPGSPGFTDDLDTIIEHARADARAIASGGFDAIMVENYNDTPFFKDQLPPESIAALTRCARAVRQAAPDLPLGVNALRNDGLSALGIALAVGADFIRVNVLSGAMVTDQGLVEGCAAQLLRKRAALKADIAILADVGVKHATPLGMQTLFDAARDTAHRGHADGLIVSGASTGATTAIADIEEVRSAVPDIPIFIGSGVTAENIDGTVADGFIVGTSLKTEGRVDAQKVAALKLASSRSK